MSIYGLAARAVMFAAPKAPAAVAAAGVLGVMDALAQLSRIAGAIQALARGGMDRAAEDMVRLMRERGPDDTYRLERGTVWRRDGETIVVSARAIRQAMAGQEDYAPFVEFGTEKMEAQPFFLDSAREVMEAQRKRFEADLDRLAAEANAS
jgi:hypothetical protein